MTDHVLDTSSWDDVQRRLNDLTESGQSAQRATERLASVITDLIDERIESALAAERARSLQQYVNGRRDGSESAPQVLDVEAGPVDARPAVADRLLGADLGDAVTQFTHELAPSSLAGTESVEPAAPNSSASGAAGTPATPGSAA